MNIMPVILPPPAFDVPAIIRVAAHAPANQAAIHLSVPAPRGTATLANPSPQPLSSMQGPQIVTPPHVPQPLSSMQG
ncbi:MAG: hypothetical protein QOJ54_341, partial [Aliidongia sp.]|nr:hypothetical protein [Aliidongia sp.]